MKKKDNQFYMAVYENIDISHILFLIITVLKEKKRLQRVKNVKM